ncbi:MAG: NlpC/P60 family protein [Pseudomonadota bacterium]
MTQNLDKRLHAYRDDLADAELRGLVEAGRFVDGEPSHIGVAVCNLKRRPAASAGTDTQLKRNEAVIVFDEADDWSWVKAAGDGYVGYVPSMALKKGAPPEPTQRICAPRTFCYPEPDLKVPPVETLSIGTNVCAIDRAETRGTPYTKLATGGWVFAHHLSPIDTVGADYVAVAETLLGTPYLWGGNTAFGIDCSGLVQLSMSMCGKQVSRDSDMQFETLGVLVNNPDDLQRGDLIFWKGHVAIVRDENTIIHANAHSMMVNIESTADAIERIAYLYAEPIGYKRPD